jgi:pilus assembly protein CpaF
VHANTTRDALSRLEVMVSMANLNLPDRAVRQQIASAIDLIIQVSRLGDGARKVITITELTGMEGEVITLQDIFVFEREGVGAGGKVLGRFRPTGIRPRFADRLRAYGKDLPGLLFAEEPSIGNPNATAW